MTLIYKGAPVELAPGTTLLDFAKREQQNYDAPIILAKYGQRLVELNKVVPTEGAGDELKFITTKDPDGHRTYERGATMMFLRAATHVFGKKIEQLKVEYCLVDSLFFSVRFKDGVDAEGTLTDETVAEVEATMKR